MTRSSRTMSNEKRSCTCANPRRIKFRTTWRVRNCCNQLRKTPSPSAKNRRRNAPRPVARATARRAAEFRDPVLRTSRRKADPIHQSTSINQDESGDLRTVAGLISATTAVRDPPAQPGAVVTCGRGDLGDFGLDQAPARRSCRDSCFEHHRRRAFPPLVEVKVKPPITMRRPGAGSSRASFARPRC